MEKTEFGLGLQRGEEFETVTQKRNSRPREHPMEPKGLGSQCDLLGRPCHKPAAIMCNRCYFSNSWVEARVPSAESGNLRSLYLLVVMGLFRPRANSCPSKAGEGCFNWGPVLGSGAPYLSGMDPQGSVLLRTEELGLGAGPRRGTRNPLPA